MTQPRYETLELVVPEVQLRERYRRGWLVVATIVAFAAGLLIGYAVPTVAASSSISGYATWLDTTPGTAAAGPALRSWLGPDWRGQTVKVCHGGCVLVALTDWCACADRSGKPTLVDLSRSDFAVIGDPGAGVISVTVNRGGAVALPATDTAPDTHGFGILLIVALVFWFAFGIAYWAFTTRLRLGRDRREHRRREHR